MLIILYTVTIEALDKANIIEAFKREKYLRLNVEREVPWIIRRLLRRAPKCRYRALFNRR